MMGIQIIHPIEDIIEECAGIREVRNLIIEQVISIRKNDILILKLNYFKDIITIFSREKPSSS